MGTDEDEPEVLFDGLHHADEHMGLEMTLHILHWLTDGYGSSARITSIVNSREIWIVFAMNPDGAQFDIKGGRFHFWRKNRQPTPGSSAIGTDLNRNYDYRWGIGRPDEQEPRGDHVPRARGRSRRRRRGPCATSSPRASSAAGSRSASRSRSTRPAGS